MTQAMPPIVSSPTTPTGKNTAFNPVFGLVDILVRMTDEAVEEKVDDPLLARQVGGPAKLTKGPLIREANGDIPITFAVDQSKLAKGGVWEGSLRLTATQQGGKAKTLEVKLKVKRQERVTGLFVFFVVHSKPKKTNAWVRLNVVDAADGKTPIKGATVKLKLLRDNYEKQGYAKINRRIELKSDSAGYLECGKDRTTLALPIEWPLILIAEAAGHVPRGHMLRIAAAEAKKDQTTPLLPAVPIRMTATANASLAGKTFVLDPGHGVVYGLKKQRRSQEWYVAHRLSDRIAEILVRVGRMSALFTSPHRIPDCPVTRLMSTTPPYPRENKLRFRLALTLGTPLP
jgi:N-acetylmuramoyl-L-alanine amidase